jgi:hypothetical protein
MFTNDNDIFYGRYSSVLISTLGHTAAFKVLITIRCSAGEQESARRAKECTYIVSPTIASPKPSETSARILGLL